MARQINVPSRQYSAGTVLERSVDSFPVGVQKVVVRLSRESWPGTPSNTVAILTVLWGNGGGARAEFPGGTVLDRADNPVTHSIVEIDIPQEADGQGGKRNRNEVSATATLEIVQTLRTAISAEAV